MQDLLDYSVDITGATDCTTQVQSAVDGCGGLLEWNGGNVRIDGTVTITSPIRIIGSGIDQWKNGTAACNVWCYGSVDTFHINSNNVHLDGLNFVGTGGRYASNGPSAIVVGSSGSDTFTGLTLSRVGAASHGCAVHFLRASNWVMERCDLQSFNAVVVENLINVDKGDSTITHSDFAADATSGVCVLHKSSGGLRIINNKFLTCQDSIYVNWVAGLSGGPIIIGNSLENMARNGIFVYGAGSSSILNGMIISNNWINGAVNSIFVGDTVAVKRAQICGNNIVGGSTSIGINFGALMTDFWAHGNMLDGNGVSPSYGMFTRSGSTGRIGPNNYKNWTTNIYNGSTGVTITE